VCVLFNTLGLVPVVDAVQYPSRDDYLYIINLSRMRVLLLLLLVIAILAVSVRARCVVCCFVSSGFPNSDCLWKDRLAVSTRCNCPDICFVCNTIAHCAVYLLVGGCQMTYCVCVVAVG
jgi:hypothetical protein